MLPCNTSYDPILKMASSSGKSMDVNVIDGNNPKFSNNGKERARKGKRHETKKVRLYKSKPKKSETEIAEIERLKSLYEQIDASKVKTFFDFPLSRKTKLGLEKNDYKEPTEIQRESIGLALRGLDILGAAKTGSGKTLAFLIPVLECLYRERWTCLDGLGALIITPTRELAYQIFEVLCKVGASHDFSAGLIIGGKDLKFERKRMDKCNIVICTPGRLLQHMDENPLFDCTSLRILVLDEADRILDLGFEKTMNAIIASLPAHRQTLLFSATQTKSVKDLARLSLKNPMYVSVHEHAKHSTPETLVQNYIVCELHEKMNMLWSFIRSHLKQKILVFFSSCKQVKYAYEIFCRMRPGMTVLALYGTLHQLRRMAIYDEFCRKEHAVLFATDIASRGLDFPSINWVVQLDCPEDVNTYIHRVGRTARYQKGGEALLILLPSEQPSMVEQFKKCKIPINKIEVNPNRFFNVQRKMEALCARDVQLKESAQRALIAYLKSVFLMKDKSVFDVNKLDTEAFARSLGLVVAPRIRFLQKYQKMQQQKNALLAKKQNKNQPDANPESSSDEVEERQAKPKEDHKLVFRNSESEDDSEDDLFTVKRVIYPDPETQEEQASEETSKEAKPITKASVVKKMLKKNIKANKKVLFDEEGQPIEETPQSFKSERAKELLKQMPASGISIEAAKELMKEEDKVDKEFYRKLIKMKHKEERMKLKAERKIQEIEELERKAKHWKPRRKVNYSDEESSGGEFNPLIEDLPDPDKVYDKEDRHMSEEAASDNGSYDSSEEVTRKRIKIDNDDMIEELALNLLKETS